jgi:hypothetical protein
MPPFFDKRMKVSVLPFEDPDVDSKYQDCDSDYPWEIN